MSDRYEASCRHRNVRHDEGLAAAPAPVALRSIENAIEHYALGSKVRAAPLSVDDGLQ